MSIPERTVIYASGRAASGDRPALNLLHYNDVYHLDPSSAEPVGGLARFMTVVKDYQARVTDPRPLTFFSGDAFNPSLESSITKGEHMVAVLNNIGTDVACVGNHDLDFGVGQFRSLTSRCNFPWLLANVLDPALGEDVPLGNAHKTVMLTATNGLKIGVIGLGEREWLETINSLPANLVYLSATATAKRLVPDLRAQGADMIVCVSHQREPNDIKLARQTDGLIDIVLGGHDHFYHHNVIGTTHVLRSGTDFKQLSFIQAWRKPGGGWDFDIERRNIVSAVAEHAETVDLVHRLTSELKATLEKPVGWTAAPLDARFSTVRLRESNMGNFVCDLMRLHYDGDCAIMAAGTIRGDQIYAPGAIRIKDITNCFPFEDPVVVIMVTPKQLWQALENGVSLYPALEGRFPQVSNLHFLFDPSQPPGSRIQSARVRDEPLDPTDESKKYRLVTRGYMARGKDGYRSLLVKSEGGDVEEIVSEENGMLISMILRQYFMSLRIIGLWKNWCPSMRKHWDKVSDKACPTIISPTSPIFKKHGVASSDSADGGEKKVEARGPSKSVSQIPLDKHGRLRAPSVGWNEWTATSLRARQASVSALDEDHTLPGMEDLLDGKRQSAPQSAEVRVSRVGDGGNRDEDGNDDDDTGPATSATEDVDRSLRLARWVIGKWSRLAGVEVKCCDAITEDEFEIDWTRAIAPRLEGRIKMVGDDSQGMSITIM